MTRNNTGRRLLFYVEQDYSFAILRPLQTEARQREYEVRWLIVGDASADLLQPDEVQVDIAAAIGYRPDAVFVPGDRVPSFLPGIKVQVFHGINEDKRGYQIPERGLFDLYCAQNPSQADMLKPFEKERAYFRVVTTGWLKLDAILKNSGPDQSYDRPQILFASTFTPSLSGAEALYEEIKHLSQNTRWQWLITLHPKMAEYTVKKYVGLKNDNLSFFDTSEVINLLRRADAMVCDNSSILQEFLILGKPVVTFRNRMPQPCMIDIQEPGELQAAIESALNPDASLQEAIKSYGPSVTPFLDGQSSSRILDATEEMLVSDWQDRKPANLWRNWKIRRQLKYYKF